MCAERGLGFPVDHRGWLWHPLNDPLSWVPFHVDMPTGMSLGCYIGAGGGAKCALRRCAVLGSARRQQCDRVPFPAAYPQNAAATEPLTAAAFLLHV
jgi:hypothetical protein